MGDVPKSAVLCLVIAAFVFGVIAGKNGIITPDNSSEKEVLQLSIELTKLKIKELKANNG